MAWLFLHSTVRGAEARRSVHTGGIAWIVACLALAWQTAAGGAVTDLSPATVLAIVAWLVWLISAVRALLGWNSARTAMAATT